MNDLIRAGALSRLDLARLVTSEDEADTDDITEIEDEEETGKIEEGVDDTDMSSWEN